MPKGNPAGYLGRGMKKEKEKNIPPGQAKRPAHSFNPKNRPPVAGKGRPDFAGVPGVGSKGRRGRGIGSFGSTGPLGNPLDDEKDKDKTLYKGRKSVPTSRKEAGFLARYKNNG